MHTTIKRLTMLCAGACLLACASQGERSATGADADQAYLMARTYHMALRPQQALTYYQSALRSAPGHLNARNGLAVLYAEQGQLAQAIAMWQEMTASAAGREQAYLFSNLGYAHLLAGQPARALAVLEQACLLDPLNERAWQHLGDALASTGQNERAAAMHRQADSLRRHDLRSDYAMTDSAQRKAASPSDQWARTDISRDPGGIFILRRIEPEAATVPATVQVAPQPLLEISNGNGVTGMARSVARSLGKDDPRVVRLTNQKGFGVQRTRVEYQPAFRSAAEQLALRVGAAQVVRSDKTGRSDLRLVLGHDLAKPHKAVAGMPKPGAGTS